MQFRSYYLLLIIMYVLDWYQTKEIRNKIMCLENGGMLVDC